MHLRITALAVITASALTLSACSSPKAVNKANFAKAIDTLYANHCTTIRANPYGVNLSEHGFPIFVPDADESAKHSSIPKVLREMAGSEAQDRKTVAQYAALESAGLLTSAPTKMQLHGIGPELYGRRYSLTDAGKKALAEPGKINLCIGHRKVDDIVRFSEPQNAEGQTVSEASYVYSYPDAPAWTKNPAVQAAFPSLAQSLAPRQKARADLMLMNDGWQAAPAMF